MNRLSEMHCLTGLWVARKTVLPQFGEAFASIMGIEDPQHANELSAKTGKVFQGDYLKRRAQVEAWLREHCINKGIIRFGCNDVSPIYYRLYNEPTDVLNDNPYCMQVSLPVELLPHDSLSFTYDDSFHNYAVLNGEPYESTPAGVNPKVYSASELSAELQENGFPAIFSGVDPGRYIECQAWLTTYKPNYVADAVLAQVGSTESRHVMLYRG